MVVGLFASVAYDQAFLNPSEDFTGGSSSAGCQCSTTGDHADITLAAAGDAGQSYDNSVRILGANLDRDSGWANLFNNESHFDYAAKGTYDSYGSEARKLLGQGLPFDHPDVVKAVGGATHHLQDQYALGHIFPGTSLFRGAAGSPIRFIIHNVIGGEVAFRQASYDATRNFLQSLRGVSPLSA